MADIPKKYIRKRETVERIEVVGPMDKYDDVVVKLINEGWRVVRGGPYCDKKMWPNVDPNRFKYILEQITKE